MPPKMETMKEMMEGWEGYHSVKESKKSPEHKARFLEVINLLNNEAGYAPHKLQFLMKEAMTTSDFPVLFGEILDRQLLTGFKDTPQVMGQILRRATVPDFRTVQRFEISGGDEYLALVGEKGEYLASTRDVNPYTYNVDKRGRQFDISWEAIINDDLGALQDTPMRFAKAARRSEERFQTLLFVDLNGPLDAYFSVANGGAAVTNTPLTIANLETAVEAMAAFLDRDGSPILNKPKYLVCGPALEFTARQILTSANKMWVSNAAGAPVAFPTNNVIGQFGLQLVINPWIPVLVTAGTVAQTMWMLFSDPADIAAAEFGLLRGHESPELFMKASDQARVGGGMASPMDGDFATDNIFYKVRHVFGGVTLSGRAGFASDGQ